MMCKYIRWNHGKTAGHGIFSGWGRTIASLLLCAMLLQMSVAAECAGVLQSGIAGQILRFHVYANSDTDRDQEVKEEVRTCLNQYLSTWLDGCSREETIQFLNRHLRRIEQIANRCLKQAGVQYQAHAEMTVSYYTERQLGSYVFPAGWYQSFRVRLGSGQGHNWWGILYPGLCYSDCLELEDTLTLQEYQTILHNSGRWKIRFRFFTWLNALL